MNLFNNKKSEALTLILVVVIIVVFLGWLINFSSKECRSNAQCSNGYYCGSDFTCHQVPTIEKTVVKNNLITPSIIIGIAVVIAAIILRFGKKPFDTKQKETTQEFTNKNPLKMP